MKAAMQRLYALLTATWPTGALLLHPDDKQDFEAALDASSIVVRYYQPQPFITGALNQSLCHVDVCSRTLDAASTAADKLLARIGSNNRKPTGLLRPKAVHIRETSYERVHVTFTAFTDPT